LLECARTGLDQMKRANDVPRIRILLSFGKVEIFFCVSDLCL
jgi:hypothetical protein